MIRENRQQEETSKEAQNKNHVFVFKPCTVYAVWKPLSYSLSRVALNVISVLCLADC